MLPKSIELSFVLLFKVLCKSKTLLKFFYCLLGSLFLEMDANLVTDTPTTNIPTEPKTFYGRKFKVGVYTRKLRRQVFSPDYSRVGYQMNFINTLQISNLTSIAS